MRIWHRGHIGIEHKPFLERWRVDHKPWFSAVDPNKVNSYMFTISEDHPAWTRIKEAIGGGDKYYISTEFTKEEISEAEWSIAHATHSITSLRSGSYGWSTEFFVNQCISCGAGWRQIAPFRLKREPALGKSAFADFGSAFEVFCVPEVLEVLREKNFQGFDALPLVVGKQARPVESLRQLIVTAMARPAIAEEMVEHECYGQTDCLVCGRTWHAHYTRGILPLRREALRKDVDFQLTSEWFGNGRTARHEILVSRRVVALVHEMKWRGIRFTPVQVV